jgi:hypothetical protein
MWISESSTARTHLAREIALLALAATCVILIASPSDPVLRSWSVHPIWALAPVLAARYGAPGLWIVPALALGLTAANVVVGGSGEAAIARMSGGGDLLALAATALCAAVGAAHERRKALLEARVAQLETQATTAEATVDELAETAIALNHRCNHSITSLAFLSDVAARMSDEDPTRAGEAALELALARTGARCGFVQLRDDTGRLSTVASHGPVMLMDRTAMQALQRGVVVQADEVPGVRPEDSDVAAPLVDDTGWVVGVLALQGVPYSALARTMRAEVESVARWMTRSLPQRSSREVSDAPGFYSFTKRRRGAQA